MEERTYLFKKNGRFYVKKESVSKDKDGKWSRKHIRNLGKPLFDSNDKPIKYKDQYLWIKSKIISEKGIKGFLSDPDQYLLDYFLYDCGVENEEDIKLIKDYILGNKKIYMSNDLELDCNFDKSKTYLFRIQLPSLDGISLYLYYDPVLGVKLTDRSALKYRHKLYIYNLPVSQEIISRFWLKSRSTKLIFIKKSWTDNPLKKMADKKGRLKWNRFIISEDKSLLYRIDDVPYKDVEIIAVLWIKLIEAVNEVNSDLKRRKEKISNLDNTILALFSLEDFHIKLLDICLKIYVLLMKNVSNSAKEKLLEEESLFYHLLKSLIF